jgi:hypothetical protein
MTDQPDLFPGRRAKQRGTSAPDGLTTRQLKALSEWAEEKVPWLSREVLESFESVESYVEECLDWWRGDGGLKVDWVATVRNRIRTKERGRLAKLARMGNTSAAQALRDPRGWADAFDARARATSIVATWEPADEIIPTGGGQVIELEGRRRR